MKKKISKKFLVIFVSLLPFIIVGVVLACGFDPEMDWRLKFFSQEVSRAEKYKPFFRTFYDFYDGKDADNITDFNTINTDEWRGFFKNQVTADDLSYLIYKARLGEVDTLIFFLKNANYPIKSQLRKNTILNVEDKAAVREFLYYIGYARRCEPFVTFVPGWEWENKEDPRKQTKAMNDQINGGQKLITFTKNQFVNQRYLFQIIRLYYMSAKFSEGYNFYIQNVNLVNQFNNSIKYRIMEYAAGTLYKMKRYGESNYLFSIIYDQYDPLKKSTFRDFHPQEEADWKKCLALAVSPREKAVLWQLLGIYKDPLRAMQEIYQIDTKSELLDLLVARAVSIEEENFIPDRYVSEENSSSYSFNRDKLDNGLFVFISNIAGKENTNKPYLWNIAAGYLSAIRQNYDQAEKYYVKALNQAKNVLLVTDQIRLLRVISKIEQVEKPNSDFENKITRELIWLNDKNRKSELKDKEAFEWALKRLSVKYSRNNEPIKAVCLNYRKTAFYNDMNNIQAMINFMDKKNKSDFEKFILEVFPYERSNMFEILAIPMVYEYKFSEAIAKFQECEGSGSRELRGDPFLIHINDCHDCDFAAKQSKTYTKIDFLKAMIELEDKAVKDAKNAPKYYFQLANGYYNMTYFGNARKMYETCLRELTNIGFKGSYGGSLEVNDPIMNCAKAEEYYKKAMELSTDKEFKAQCCFMAAKCEQNAFFVNGLANYKGDFKSGNYFRQLKTEFATSKYYKEIINECGYFVKFVTRR